MRLNESLMYIYEKVDELTKHFDQDDAELNSVINSAKEVIKTNDTRGQLKEFRDYSESMKRNCDDIETSIHQMEIHMLSINRRLFGAHASILIKLKALADHVKQGYLDFDEYEDMVE